MSEVVAQDAVRFVCPFCKGSVSAGEVREPGASTSEPYVMHAVPTCAEFNDNPPDVHLRKVRRIYSG